MIYIGTTRYSGSAIYFDIYATVRQGRGMRISGTVGDGCYEGEVLVEVGRSESVTFADAWLNGSGFVEFLDRCGADALEKALLESVREMPLQHARRSRPHGNRPTYGEALVSESAIVWNQGV
ncbi:MAG: hypothetical protein OEL80_01985 [Desulfuromonadales bacterium]|jgi:hypothetical protein|nr:hypothetical protein [Desulfuromonadales bacterium]